MVFKTLAQTSSSIKDYLLFIFKTIGPYFTLSGIIGLAYLVKKNMKFGIFSIIALIANFYLITQYYTSTNAVNISFIVILLTISNGYFLLLLWDLKNYLFSFHWKKPQKNNGLKEKISWTNKLATILLLVLFIIQPVLIASNNYSKADNSQVDDIYFFWKKLINNIPNDSSLYVSSYSENIGAIINKDEYQSKNIKFITKNLPDYSVENMLNDFLSGKFVYFIGNEDIVKNEFNCKNTDIYYFWSKYNENISLKEIVNQKQKISISYIIDNKPNISGDTFKLEYTITNSGNNDLKIDSLELKLPESLTLVEVDKSGAIKDSPGLSQAKFMWVSKNYILKGNESINLVLVLRVKKAIDEYVAFRVTSEGIYFKCDDIKIDFPE